MLGENAIDNHRPKKKNKHSKPNQTKPNQNKTQPNKTTANANKKRTTTTKNKIRLSHRQAGGRAGEGGKGSQQVRQAHPNPKSNKQITTKGKTEQKVGEQAGM